MKSLDWKNDSEYMAIVGDLLEKKEVQKLDNYTQHHNGTRLDHCISVSYESYLLAKKHNLDAVSTARAGLLHDLFYYDWRTTKFTLGSHAFIHTRVALRNAEKLTVLNDKEKDIILKHMWGATIARPKYFESSIVSFVDDEQAITEYFDHVRKEFKMKLMKYKEKVIKFI